MIYITYGYATCLYFDVFHLKNQIFEFLSWKHNCDGFKNVVVCKSDRRTIFLYQKNLIHPNINHLSTVETTFLKNNIMQLFAVMNLFFNSETLYQS
jgi:hypothetical protein